MLLNLSNVKNTKNLLAFSGGIDSSALFFLLLNKNIKFDLVIVNYNLRKESLEEVNYAKKLAKKYNKKIFIKEVDLKNISNMEKTARDIRYTFFDNVILQNNYETLITAHQLNDQLEWLLMQITKGAGLVELIGFNSTEKRKNYTIFKPLLNTTKKDLELYLKDNNKEYFIDQSNFNQKYKRNYFRHNFSDKLLENFEPGIKKSFLYLKNDIKSLKLNEKLLLKEKKLEIFKNTNDDNINIRLVDISLKKRGILLSRLQRDEILKQKEITISHKINIGFTDNYIFIAPRENTTMDKKFKDFCRLKKIPKNIRPYIYKNNIKLDI